MEQSDGAEHGDPDLPDKISKIVKNPKSEKGGNQFEKNYPKNIFIPII